MAFVLSGRKYSYVHIPKALPWAMSSKAFSLIQSTKTDATKSKSKPPLITPPIKHPNRKAYDYVHKTFTGHQ